MYPFAAFSVNVFFLRLCEAKKHNILESPVLRSRPESPSFSLLRFTTAQVNLLQDLSFPLTSFYPYFISLSFFTPINPSPLSAQTAINVHTQQQISYCQCSCRASFSVIPARVISTRHFKPLSDAKCFETQPTKYVQCRATIPDAPALTDR